MRDWIDISPEGFTFRKKPNNHVIGKKPQKFCFWLFECLGLQPNDEFVDLFPGTGAVSLAWEKYCSHYGKIRNNQFLIYN